MTRSRVVPLIGLGVLIAAPLGLPNQILAIVHFSFIFAIFAASWDLLYGYGGQVSLGHGFPFGLSAFLAVILVVAYGFSPWLSLVSAAFLGAGASLLLALPSLRIRGMYLAITTLAMMYIAGAVSLILTTEEGIPGFLNVWPYPMERFFNGELIPNYYLGLGLMVISLLILYGVGKSRVGIKFLAIRDDAVACQSLGINVTRYKVLAFFLSSFFAGIAGSYYSLYLGHASYTYFDLSVFFAAAAMVIVGGVGTIFGSVLGAMLLEGVSLYLGTYGAFRLIVFGLLIMVFIRFMPEGLIKGLRPLYGKRRM